MPIKGLSEVRRLPRIGKVRLGIKETSQKSGNEFPRPVDYFVVNADQTTSEAAAEAFHRVYGDKPRELDIMFPVEDRDKFFAQFYRRYGSGTGLLCKGDGETAMELNRETGEIQEIECNPTECEWVQKGHCRPVGTLQFLLYKVPGLGVWQIDTSSYNSIINLNSAIDFVRALTGGRIAMIPLKLVIRPKEVQVEGKKKTVYVLDLAQEGIRLQDILTASKAPLSQFLIPGADFNEVPDDLYPASLIDSEPEGVTPKPVDECETSDHPAKIEPKSKPEVKPKASARTTNGRAKAGGDWEEQPISKGQRNYILKLAGQFYGDIPEKEKIQKLLEEWEFDLDTATYKEAVEQINIMQNSINADKTRQEAAQ
ncbi:MAG TPA: hypothetical protein GXX51_06890 [Firmicutes bacterium]|nr:hypothetical protein [Bacillota bacterium]